MTQEKGSILDKVVREVLSQEKVFGLSSAFQTGENDLRIPGRGSSYCSGPQRGKRSACPKARKLSMGRLGPLEPNEEGPKRGRQGPSYKGPC